jgi:hypothetical protein
MNCHHVSFGATKNNLGEGGSDTVSPLSERTRERDIVTDIAGFRQRNMLFFRVLLGESSLLAFFSIMGFYYLKRS